MSEPNENLSIMKRPVIYLEKGDGWPGIEKCPIFCFFGVNGPVFILLVVQRSSLHSTSVSSLSSRVGST